MITQTILLISQTGSDFDENGNVRNWWTNKSRENFVKRSTCLINQYNKVKLFGYKVCTVSGVFHGDAVIGVYGPFEAVSPTPKIFLLYISQKFLSTGRGKGGTIFRLLCTNFPNFKYKLPDQKIIRGLQSLATCHACVQPRSQGFSVRTRRDTRKPWSGPVT